jgi:predicted transcriptional regulator
MSSNDSSSLDFVALAADVVSAFVGNNSVPVAELPGLISSVHAALVKIAGNTVTAAALEPEVLTPAVSVSKSLTPDHIICLDDGKRFKSLKRHLATLGMTPDQYRAKWSLPADYPMVASNYAATRSALAKKIGLGQGRRKSA